MQKLLFLISVALFTACSSPSKKEEKTSVETTSNTPSTRPEPLSFEESSFDFGTTKQGSVVQHVYSFENKSDKVILILNATASCGCTVPNYPKEPIEPGQKGEIYVEFNSSGKKGQQNKTISVETNASDSPIKLTLTGYVEVDENK